MKIYAKDYNIVPNIQKDQTLQLNLLLNSIRSNSNKEAIQLIFEPGVYYFSDKHAYEKLCYISNHSEDNLKRFALNLSDINNLTIDCNNSTFYTSNSVGSLLLYNSSNIKLKNLVIDCKRHHQTISKIVEVNENEIILEILNNEFVIENGKIFFTGEIYKEEPWDWSILEYDNQKLCPTQGSSDKAIGIPWSECNFEYKNENYISIKGNFKRLPEKSNYLVFRHGVREIPAIFIENSSNIYMENVTIHHARGMGVLAQLSKNLEFNNLCVVPREGELLSTIADATHFTSCEGDIKFNNCTFKNHLDDAINIHGIYYQIEEILDEYRLLLKLVHGQQKGMNCFDNNHEVQIINNDTFEPLYKSRVLEFGCINKDYYLIKLKDKLDSNIKKLDCIENITLYPRVYIGNSHFEGNRARGILLTSRKETIVENNYFSIPGSAIKISGDCNSWFESGQCMGVKIRKNHFKDCVYCHGPWGKSVIDIDPEIPVKKDGIYYHKNIEIAENHFETFDNLLVKGHSIETFTFKDNKITKTNTYIENNVSDKNIDLEYVKNILN